MAKVAEWVVDACARLEAAGVSAFRLEPQILAAHALGWDRSRVLAHPEVEVPAGADLWLERRLRGEPLAYILGYREFYGRRFTVDPRVLIPRHETETLIEAFFALEAGLPRDARVMDLGTGSGCLGITLALERPSLRVTLSDVSSGALDVAQENASTLGPIVQIAESDMFANVSDPFDAIVSNPPYVATSDPLPREISEFEPSLALFAGDSGLDFYRRIALEVLEPRNARNGSVLRAGGLLILEIGAGQREGVEQVFAAWECAGVFRDLSGVERVLAFRAGR